MLIIGEIKLITAPSMEKGSLEKKKSSKKNLSVCSR